jgi:D-alanyl-lipoteichoic acid acyltransferase DltB (MBOAT superfamily)
MVFTSLDFLKFFCAVLALYFFLPHKVKWAFLLAASIFFYGFWKVEYVFFLIIPTVIVYFICIKLEQIESDKLRKFLLVVGLFSGLAVLLVFKYTDFFGHSLFSVASLFIDNLTFRPLQFIWPIGVSFYSFKLVSYLVDVYNKNCKVERHLGYFSLYVSFFPQLLAGPIDRAVNFIPELRKRVNFDIPRIISGFRLIVWGVFKKMVIADRLAIFVDEVFKSPETQGINLIFAAYFYGFQIYCDFSGYSDIAIGISRILGFKSMKNFDFPYFSKNMTQFWNKWHISLSTWLRDYLFLPIAYAVMRRIKTKKLMRVKAEVWGYAIGMFLTMFLGGLWHGAAWTFVVWGSLHGLFLITGYITKKSRKKLVKKIKLKKLPKLHYLFSILFTFNLVSFAWIFFKAESFEKAISYIKCIQFQAPEKGLFYLFFNLFFIFIFLILEIIYKNRNNIPVIQNLPMWLKIAGFAFFICFIILFSMDTSNEFIYFQF